jgi:UDP-N-acetylglucosamine--N-acetylmuramyl-(pentapeptide) pyrophosphoryl-undecaprenol N-acetylglucosamine transferase
MRVMIAGGGTGGHVIPALAIADALKSAYNAEVCFIGTPRGMETRLVPQAGYELELIDVGQLNRVSLAIKLKTLVALPRGILHCLGLLRRWEPQVVVGVGGYASGPAMLAALILRVPTLAFEPNAVPGMANRLIGKRISAAAVNFAPTRSYFRNAEVTGIPVRAEFFGLPPRPPESVPRLLVMGGSQGARALNQKMPQIANALLESVSGKPSLLVPFPQAADDHQRKNAEVLLEGGAAAMLLEQDMTEASLLDTLRELLSTPGKLQEMATRARTFAYPQAAARIAEMVAGLAASHSQN